MLGQRRDPIAPGRHVEFPRATCASGRDNQVPASIMSMPVVEIENLTKDFQVGFWKKRPVRALDSLSLQVQKGEIFGFLGPNGAGKSTTLKILMNLLRPTSGNARILGKPIDSVSMHQAIGYLPENPYFYDYLTPEELLSYVGSAETRGIERFAQAPAPQILQRDGSAHWNRAGDHQ